MKKLIKNRNQFYKFFKSDFLGYLAYKNKVDRIYKYILRNFYYALKKKYYSKCFHFANERFLEILKKKNYLKFDNKFKKKLSLNNKNFWLNFFYNYSFINADIINLFPITTDRNYVIKNSIHKILRLNKMVAIKNKILNKYYYLIKRAKNHLNLYNKFKTLPPWIKKNPFYNMGYHKNFIANDINLTTHIILDSTVYRNTPVTYRKKSVNFLREYKKLNLKLSLYYGFFSKKKIIYFVKELKKNRYNSILKLVGRLSFFIYSVNLENNIFIIQKMIKKGYFLVNKKIIFNPDHVLNLNDIVSINKLFFKKFYDKYKNNLKAKKIFLNFPLYIEFNYKILSGSIWRNPKFEEVVPPQEFPFRNKLNYYINNLDYFSNFFKKF